MELPTACLCNPYCLTLKEERVGDVMLSSIHQICEEDDYSDTRFKVPSANMSIPRMLAVYFTQHQMACFDMTIVLFFKS